MVKCIFLLLLGVIPSITSINTCCQILKPDQIRLAVATDSSVNVGWHIRTCPLDITNPLTNPIVIFGTCPTTLTSTSVYIKSSFYESNFVLGMSWFYSVELQYLEPSTMYYYQIVGSGCVSSSSILNFTSAPFLGDRSRPVRIAAYGDLGVDGLLGDYTNGPCLFEQALNALQTKLSEIDFFLHHGDICYADNTPILVFLKTYEQAMDYCQAAMSVLTSARMYMTATGNHEINCTQVPGAYYLCLPNYKQQIPYSHRFNMPSNHSGGYLNTWYSFNYAFIHVITISCETDFPNAPSGNLLDNTTQINWLINDLARVNRSVTPWVIVQCHRPWKGSAAKQTIAGIVNYPQCQAAFEQILIDNNVDIYFNGHVHWYERICFNDVTNTTNYINPSGPVYLTNGGIGNPEGNESVGTEANNSCVIKFEPGFGILTVYDDSHATFIYYSTFNLTIMDEFNITKDRSSLH
ncbi:unnamed protein product [Adineta steineri]|uniref:Purple acid phosphatase n=1 Tax=Adineta steineri TaxID=433720 RepID=A0A819PKP3_9BILA|nr:unnamed protein product [Adineta steineri]CAF4012240.1 unnamed protein product [Adineta steineri]